MHDGVIVSRAENIPLNYTKETNKKHLNELVININLHIEL